ncbi:family 16 glycoside hydrolase [Microbacterium saperdae]|nr:family 16 glycoside hydrolase [Microbacterium saperdae]
MTMPTFTSPLTELPEGARLRSVTGRPAPIAGRTALRVELTDDITAHGTPGVDYVDQATFVELPVTLRTGVIEVDILSRLNGKTDFPSRAFAGIVFHVQEDASAFQSVYLRPLNGRKVNPPTPRDQRAIQYFAYPDWPFDRLRTERPDGPHEAGADIGPDEWNTLRVDIGEAQITATVNDVEVLDIDRPLIPPHSGTVGLFVDIGTEAFFSRLTVSTPT